jgi:hypothetical protein
MARDKGNINQEVFDEEDRLVAALERNDFCVVGVATDGDPGVYDRHKEFFQRYYKEGVEYRNLDNVIAKLMGSERIIRRMPITDLFHWYKNCRSRVINATVGLSLFVDTPLITVDSLMQSTRPWAWSRHRMSWRTEVNWILLRSVWLWSCSNWKTWSNWAKQVTQWVFSTCCRWWL